jgi:hypothetical protein
LSRCFLSLGQVSVELGLFWIVGSVDIYSSREFINDMLKFSSWYNSWIKFLHS